MEQAALLRAYAVDRIHERDSLVEVALAFVANTVEAQSSKNSGDAGDNGYDAQAVQELLEWRKRLGEETKELDPGKAVDGKRGCRTPQDIVLARYTTHSNVKLFPPRARMSACIESKEVKLSRLKHKTAESIMDQHQIPYPQTPQKSYKRGGLQEDARERFGVEESTPPCCLIP